MTLSLHRRMLCRVSAFSHIRSRGDHACLNMVSHRQEPLLLSIKDCNACRLQAPPCHADGGVADPALHNSTSVIYSKHCSSRNFHPLGHPRVTSATFGCQENGSLKACWEASGLSLLHASKLKACELLFLALSNF